jgi:hypothetical protein
MEISLHSSTADLIRGLLIIQQVFDEVVNLAEFDGRLSEHTNHAATLRMLYFVFLLLKAEIRSVQYHICGRAETLET